MMLENPRAHLVLALLSLMLAMTVAEFTDLDMLIQQRLYQAATHQWIWDRHEPVSRLLLYDGIKALLIVTGVALAVQWWRHRQVDQGRQRVWLAALLTLLLVPSATGLLKAGTNVACPQALQVFGGELPQVGVFQAWPSGQRPASRQRCFPAGHASGGFGLLGLVFLARRRRVRVAIVLGVLVLGWLMGLYKMAIGDHFFSHTWVSMLLGWLTASLAGVWLRASEVASRAVPASGRCDETYSFVVKNT